MEIKPHILVVDDEREIRDFLSKALTRIAGFQVELAENGEEALKKVEKGRFDLILTDLKMPMVDGLQLITEISQSNPEILTVLMTGHGTIDSAIEAMKYGAFDYILKPFPIPQMKGLVEKGLEGIKGFAKALEQLEELLATKLGKSVIIATGGYAGSKELMKNIARPFQKISYSLACPST
jgi:DNA-binding NtrC family response regulator